MIYLAWVCFSSCYSLGIRSHVRESQDYSVYLKYPFPFVALVTFCAYYVIKIIWNLYCNTPMAFLKTSQLH